MDQPIVRENGTFIWRNRSGKKLYDANGNRVEGWIMSGNLNTGKVTVMEMVKEDGDETAQGVTRQFPPPLRIGD